MFLVFWLVISIVTGALAARKGYNFILWALAAGILGLIILAFLPFANKPDQPPEEQARLKKTGNTVGGVLAALGIIVLAVKFLPS
jgi:4-hydroxybenzoate polyprenyltransferase